MTSSDLSLELAALQALVSSLWRRAGEPELPADQPLHLAGLDSIQLAELGGKLQERHGVEVAPQELFGLTPRDLASRLRGASPCRPASQVVKPLRVEAAVRPAAPAPSRQSAPAVNGNGTLRFSLFYFGECAVAGAPYELLMQSARVADELGFHAIWLPERHFHPFGGISPNPSVLAAALSRTTQQLRLRAGSVILPLHNPLRVAEEWAVVDQLSGGRVDIAFGSGWNPDDFLLAPASFAGRRQLTLEGVETLQKLWRGEAGSAPNGVGDTVSFRLFPAPVQPELPVWLTCTHSAESFITAGTYGYNVLTALLFQTVDELALKIALYRQARQRNGHGASTGNVTVMLHTFVGADEAEVRRVAQKPFTAYLQSSASLWRRASSRLDELDAKARGVAAEQGFERYFRTAGLFGTPESCAPLVRALQAAGADELACLVDFGVDSANVLAGLPRLNELRRASEHVRAQARSA